MECDDQDSQTKDQRILQMYVTVLKRFSQALNSVSVKHVYLRVYFHCANVNVKATILRLNWVFLQ